ncbi:FXSXX-COOH protein [Actinomadura pelletieri DSM 43383]|uniref:FXSXX-COOH protein n=1 Tax=Actinomadura pelletieri DSM 43383 TaxID=1120940 RepID=A0A495R149_9ACTN|nr:FxSxx-COOH cyclophane-containing RiPP peptide [Actinomadura pelletieri]RKS79846.1 FXSXX-COOH protein [Actinomadura pelletieri DSM 43383]
MADTGVDRADQLPDVSAIPLHALDDLEESALGRALHRIFVSLDTEQAEAIAGFQSVIDEDLK